MKRIALTLALTLAAIAGAQRVDEYDSTAKPVANRVVTLVELVDGGCMMSDVCGRLSSKDGGSQIGGCEHPALELRAANRTTCLNVLDKAGVWWAGQQNAGPADSGL